MSQIIDDFEGPIPLASLTEELGSRAYEKPPLYTDPADAYEAIMDGLLTENATKRISVAVQLGVPLELVARSILFTGWATGKYSFDTFLYIAGPVLESMSALLDEAGVVYQKFATRTTEEDMDLEEAIEVIRAAKEDELTPEVAESIAQEKSEELSEEIEEKQTSEPMVARGGLMGGV